MKRILFLFLGVTAFMPNLPAHAHDQSLTIYGGAPVNAHAPHGQVVGQALVQEDLEMEFEYGEQVLNFPNVSSKILPTTVSILAEDMTVIEQNFDFDLITPKKLMEKSLGEVVTIIRTNPGSGISETKKAKILSVNDGVVVEIDGKIEVLRDDDIPTRVIFDALPENLRPEPVLSIKVDSDLKSKRPTHFSYLTSGLSWKADYIVNFDEDASTMNLEGWATLTNGTETSFTKAEVSVVAGQVRMLTQPFRHNYNYNNQGAYNVFTRYNNLRGQQNNLRNAGVESSPHEKIGNSYIYPLPGKIDILANQTKQIRIMEASNIPAKRLYEYRAFGFYVPKTPVSPDVRIAFSNSKVHGLQEALPQGNVRMFEKDSKGRSQFIGEDLIGHIPAGSTLALKTGNAFDVKVTGRVVSDTGVAEPRRTVEMEYTLSNAKKEPVTVSLRQVFPGNGSHQLLSENHESRAEDAYTHIWEVTVNAESEKVLNFKVQTEK